ncbi:helix-turn-helix domain-containing protein [Atlantibacter sp.]|uniref:helix-turn-helix domain-containing protein n=1 Tax=Atlantibacter sp. TaxID=1903473 RepID=UPI00289DD642|nr:helix-turn-helix domain-containing protein [Atlantibacter sp.]
MTYRAQVINNLIQWIDNNIELPIKINDVAARAGYSKWHLQRLFYEHTGQTLGHFIRERKLNLIAQRLITSNDPLLYLALTFGYESQQSLTRAFTKRFKLPPDQYRKRFRRLTRAPDNHPHRL